MWTEKCHGNPFECFWEWDTWKDIRTWSPHLSLLLCISYMQRMKRTSGNQFWSPIVLLTSIEFFFWSLCVYLMLESDYRALVLRGWAILPFCPVRWFLLSFFLFRSYFFPTFSVSAFFFCLNSFHFRLLLFFLHNTQRIKKITTSLIISKFYLFVTHKLELVFRAKVDPVLY